MHDQIKIDSPYPPFPMPICLVGSHVNGRANFATVAWFTMVGYQPPQLLISLGKKHHSNSGIKENKAFSVCIPNSEMVAETDCCGLVSGQQVDKSKMFELFYGQLEAAPMIAKCPINAECRLLSVIDGGDHDVFIGEIVAVYGSERFLEAGKPVFDKSQPLIYATDSKDYRTLGPILANAWNVGKKIVSSQ